MNPSPLMIIRSQEMLYVHYEALHLKIYLEREHIF